MEDHSEKIFYLVISVVYMAFSYIKKHAPKEQPADKIPKDTLPPLPPVPDGENPWKEVLQKTPVPALYTQPAISSTTLSSQPTAPQQPAIERTLSRYSSWKKAIVMSEIIRPYN